ICIGEATGAGGANVWSSDDLRAALAAAEKPLPLLPKGVSFTLAVRRAVRSGDADGTLIEDAGVSGQPYAMTRADVLDRNADMIEHCGEILAAQPLTRLEVVTRRRTLAIGSEGLDQIDLYVDGHPGGVPVALQGDGQIEIPLPRRAHSVE